ncbi:post-GPI attachment to proteins factor 2-like isoform X1 [Amphibalanus amphitrite]|uniref:post-GPI attachment to proteins factor 2-like isoform X1 n=1 Tax=Amphibalanus amphitrite TaxID=1232801 RepID=UPI001C919E85|nr:post-GPI attachment to proteins factor 2-like isoform X1 [Amphibalanus amphitrite]
MGSSEVLYQPLLGDPPAETLLSGGARLRLRFRHVLLVAVALPLFGFLFCVGWSLLFHFESATSTHCKVANYLPSLSAAIGNFTVQRRVWKTVIALHALPRFLIGYLYYGYWRRTLAPLHSARLLMLTAQVFYVSENFGLLGLSFVTSAENFPVHKSGFILFLTSAGFYMLLTIWLSGLPRARVTTRRERVSSRRKRLLFGVYCTCLTLSMYFYARHNESCEAGIYTLFALSEYLVVLSNIAFHGTAYWDMYERVFDFGTCKWS